MPKSSKKVAARQAALSKKKKRGGPRLTIPDNVTVASPSSSQAKSPPDTQQKPELDSPAGPAAPPSIALPGRPQPVATTPRAPRTPLPLSPYFKADIKTIGLLALGLIVLLVIIDLTIS